MKLKEWFIKSALLDFQNGNNSSFIFIGILIFGIVAEYNLPIALIGFFCWGYLEMIYHRFGRRYYHYAICGEYGIKPKTKNITFK